MPASRSGEHSGVRERHVPVPGAELYLREVGGGSPLVILHGGPDFNHNYLLPAMDRVTGSFRSIHYDQRGRGRSSGSVVPADVGIASELDDLDRIRRHLGLGAITLLGHSWGALLAMEYAAHHPERVSGLILINAAPACHSDLEHFRERREATAPDDLATKRAIAATPEYAAGHLEADTAYYRAHFRRTLRRPEHLEPLLGRLRAHFTPRDIVKARAIEDRLYAETWDAPGYDVLARLRHVIAPTLVIHGDHDLIPVECAIHVAEAVRGARLVVLGECGHFAYLERPDQVQAAIADQFGSA